MSNQVKRFIMITMEINISQDHSKALQRIGRPLNFDPDAALEQAMLLFWRHGYESTSVSQLTKAMGISAPSLYGHFGDKKNLFRLALARYASGAVTASNLIDGAINAKEAARTLLVHSAIGFTGADTPPGCLMGTATLSCSLEAADIQREVAALRRETEALLQRKIENDIEAGALPRDTDAETLAAYVVGFIQGLSTLARDGASRMKLLEMVKIAMKAWQP